MRAGRVTLRGVAIASAALLFALAVGGSAAAQDRREEDEGKSTDWRLAFDGEIDFEANPFAAFNASALLHPRRRLRQALNHDLETGPPDLEHSLARTYEVSGDGLVYTFHLHRGVKWAGRRGLHGGPVVLAVGRYSSTAGTGSSSASSGSQIRAARRHPSASVIHVCSISRTGRGKLVRIRAASVTGSDPRYAAHDCRVVATPRRFRDGV
jgi:hypothetical protein